jgi:hypothetical protein
MLLYCDPLSTVCRPILQFAAEHDLPLEHRHVDLMSVCEPRVIAARLQ